MSGAAPAGGGAPADGGYDALRSSVAARLLPRDVLRVSGADAASYLQGQCSQDIEHLGPGDSAEALLLSPQGKVEAYVRVSSLGPDGYVLDGDAGTGPAIEARLARFRLRVKVDLEPLDWACVAVRGPGSREVVAGTPALTCAVDWPGLSGVDLLGPVPGDGAGSPPDADLPWLAPGTTRCDGPAWEAARIEAGIPVAGREIGEGTIAAEVGLVQRTVSLTKGCFTGQELVARLDARGSKVARTLRGVVLDPGPGVPTGSPGSLVEAAVLTADGEREVGHLSSVAWSPGRSALVALATLHRRVEPPAPVRVATATATFAAEALVLPLFPGPGDRPPDAG